MPLGARKRQVLLHPLPMEDFSSVVAAEAERVLVADTAEFDWLGHFGERILRQSEVLVSETFF